MTSDRDTNEPNPDAPLITPETKIGKLLDSYPHLEDLFLKISPEFAKLRNPILRKTIAKVATLKQAADIGKISLEDLINRLRQAVGQNQWTSSSAEVTTSDKVKPAWVSSQPIALKIDARPMLEKGEHPIDLVMKELGNLSENQILELLTPFQPQPLIDLVRSKGHHTWTESVSGTLYRTFIKS